MGSGNAARERSATGWLLQPWTNGMADLAEAVDDLICSFDYADTAMDTLVMFAFAAVLVTLLTLGLVKFLYKRYSKPKQEAVAADKPIANSVIKDVEVPVPVPIKTVAPLASARPKPTGGFAPSTPPPARKRLSRMSPGPSLDLPSKKASHAPVPACTGSDQPSVLWVNQVLVWLYNDIVTVNELVQTWIAAMNDFSKKSVEEHGIGVEIVRALDSHSPQISNIFAECDSKDDVTTTCDFEATPAFQLKAFRQKGEKVDVSHYRVNVNRFRARLNIVCITDKLTGELRCDGWPDVKVALAPVGPLKANPDESNLRDLVSEIVVSALRNTSFEFNLSQYPTCPRLKRHIESPGRMLPLHYDSMLSQDRMYTSTPSAAGNQGVHQMELQRDRRLLVKVVGAKDLGGTQGCHNPYCIVEMDEPPQKNQTAVKKDTNSPFWDEHFLFDLSPHTAEILFEVYDRSQTTQTTSSMPGSPATNHRFLGLGLVGIEELLVSPSQRQLISLQGRPMEDEQVSGVLTVEFLFIEGADVPSFGGRPFKLKETLKTVSPTGQTLTTTRTTFEQNGQHNTRLTETALKELQRSPSSAANKSTLIIHSVQRPGDYIQPSQTLGTNGLPEHKPRQKKKRDFFGTIKRRWRSKNRSMDLPDSEYEEASRIRSVSADRNAISEALSVPSRLGSRNVYSAGASPAQSGDESRNSRRSSLSEASGISAASARTFVHEASTLVLETCEAGVKRHFLVPLSVAQRPRWRRKGVKLHIYNDHTFVAKHLSGGTVCKVCNRNIARRIGKQGYECRDCLLKCHKHCHVKVVENCANTTIHSMELALLPVLDE